jgi:hypothetical protein
VCERPPPATVRSRRGPRYFWRWRVPAGSSSGSPPIAPGRRHAKTRIKEATDRAPFGPEVKQVIDELIAAVAVGAVVASTAGGNG